MKKTLIVNKKSLAKILKEVIFDYTNGYEVLTQQESEDWAEEIIKK